MTSKIEINIKVSDTEYKTFKYSTPDVNHKLIVVYKATCSSAELLVFFTNKTISRFHEQQLILTDDANSWNCHCNLCCQRDKKTNVFDV